MTEPRTVVLTRAQRAVLGELTRDGADNRAIAERLHVAVDTVKIHIKSILAAFEVTSRTAVVAELLNRRAVVRTVASRRALDNEDEAVGA